MGEWDNFNSVFWLSLAAAVFGFGGLCLKSLLKSKCSDTELCYGLIKIKRDTMAEVEENEYEIEHGIGPQPPTPTNR